MLFADVRNALVVVLRTRVLNGELTERGLARLVGVSQPHIHNVLKGARLLSPELSDEILRTLRLTLLDLIERERIEAHLSFVSESGYVYVPVLKGKIGPREAWPISVNSSDRLPFSQSRTMLIPAPVAARLGGDPRMANVFADGDVVLLDQSVRARSDIDERAHYVVKSGAGGIIRRLKLSGRTVYVISDDIRDRPSAWEAISLDDRPLQRVVRARAHLVNPVFEWT